MAPSTSSSSQSSSRMDAMMNALNEMNHNLQASRDENQHQLQNALRQQSEQFSLQLQQLLQAQRQVFDSEIGSLRAQINQPVQDPESMVPEHYSPSSVSRAKPDKIMCLRLRLLEYSKILTKANFA